MAKYCKHCKQINPDVNADFCCNGCKGAYNLVQELNLGSFYQYRPSDVVNNKVDLDNIVSLKSSFIFDNEDNTQTINLVAEGIECAACCWLIENALLKIEGVKQVKVSLASKKISITFANNLNAQELINLIYSIGYKVYPFSTSIAEKLHEAKKKALLQKMAVAAFFCMNIMLFSVSMWFGYDLSHEIEDLFKVLSFILAIPAVIYSGREFFNSAFLALKQKSTNMDCAISVAIILSFVYSIYHTFIGSGEVYFESTLMLIFFLLVGRFLEFKTKEKITLLTENILLADVKQTTLIQNGKSVDVDSSLVKKGDIILLQKGEKLATDAVLIDDIASFDLSSITGEIDPVELTNNFEVSAGSILLSDSVKLKAISDFKDNSISQISKIIESAQASKGRLQDLAERISKLYVPVVHIVALFSFILALYYFDTNSQEAFSRAIAVLIITCPCALALAIPVANTALLSRLYQKGILVKNAGCLESIEQVKNICYDKTGTLVDVKVSIPENISNEDLKVLKALTVNSKHILARKVLEQLEDIHTAEILDFQEKEGFGISAIYKYKEYRLGSNQFCETDVDSSLVFKVDDNIYQLNVVQVLNKNVKQTTQYFNNLNIKQTIISGDKYSNVKAVADKLNISFKAETKPLEKVDVIKQATLSGKSIYLGDGINDAASLAVADISISYAKASQIAQTSADIIMQNSDFSNLEYFYKQAQLNQNRIKQNLVISLAYNVLAIPFAVFGFVTPFFAALLMSASSICVILNTVRK